MRSIYNSDSSDVASDHNVNFFVFFLVIYITFIHHFIVIIVLVIFHKWYFWAKWLQMVKNCPSFGLQFYFTSGPSFAVENYSQIFEFFSFFIDSVFVHHAVKCTNKRMSINVNPITEEFRGFMGILLLLGATKKNGVLCRD